MRILNQLLARAVKWRSYFPGKAKHSLVDKAIPDVNFSIGKLAPHLQTQLVRMIPGVEVEVQANRMKPCAILGQVAFIPSYRNPRGISQLKVMVLRKPAGRVNPGEHRNRTIANY